eukprot:m.34164 g.34164  ORF g.34164 m.34164 type:complete len:1222 (-) comp9910_c0_seq1:33-3698(-)
MHIKEIIIDGFKSYAQRTVVSDFDPLFNAITGLNGSGKSNILDSICFVLGISNLSQVRAGTLQELIYKQGQAGVTKATVSIVFDNESKDQSPIGYEQYDTITVTRQIAIGGKNKYMINGHKAQQSHVANLFQSVQLNVNNPHFLIMQGRITKVLNMKPQEILSMIEEAAGTRMFESKKAAAIKTLEKKGKKWHEIISLINDEITPTLEKLRAERSSFFEFQKAASEIERLTRFLTATTFMDAEERLAEATKVLEELDDDIKSSKKRMKEIDMKKANTEQDITLQRKHREAEMQANNFAGMESSVARLSKAVIEANVDVDNASTAIKEEEAAKVKVSQQIEEIDASVGDKEEDIKAAQQVLEDGKAKLHEAEKQVEACEKNCTNAAIGASSDQNGMTFAEEKAKLQTTISTSSTTIETAEMTRKHTLSELKEREAAAKKSEAVFKRHQRDVTALEKDIHDIEERTEQLSFNEELERSNVEKNNNRRRELTHELSEKRDEMEELKAQLSAFDFNFRDPGRGFDKSKVYGTIGKLIEVDSSHVDKCGALEITAGGKLFNVVVEDVQTAKQLLERGGLKRRVTIMPLNNLDKKPISQSVVNAAKKMVGKDNVGLALEFVVHDEHFTKAMEFVFGSTLICKTPQDAKKVTFEGSTRCRSVTLDGDVFDPRGTLTGGARSSSSGVLMRLQKLVHVTNTISSIEEELASISRDIASYEKRFKEYDLCCASRDEKKQHLEALKLKLKNNTDYMKVAEVNELRDCIAKAEEEIERCQEELKSANKRLKQITTEEKKYSQQRENLIKKAEAAKKKAQANAKKEKNNVQTLTQALESVLLEKDSLVEERSLLNEKLAECSENIEKFKSEHICAKEKLEEAKGHYEEADEELGAKKATLMSIDNTIADLEEDLSVLTKEHNATALKMKNLVHSKEKNAKEKKTALSQVDRLLSQHQWIATEKKLFGVEGTPYEIVEGDQNKDPKFCKTRLVQLQQSQEKLSKNVNMKVLSMFDDAEKKYNDLLQKRAIVEEDKSKIEKAIEELDRKKNEALLKAHEKVNKDFGSIFSTLLPGTNARLEATIVEGVLEGLEIKVAFGKIWKESLTELSGGQRSLVALSLILSLLKFKPAPLYILDEVDAALDLSHTQNIGQMIRQFFKQSQFVVVSLKDGMFNNANVLFKTKFVDGVSTVRRFAQAPSSTSENISTTTATTSSSSSSRGKRAKKVKALSTRQRH